MDFMLSEIYNFLRGSEKTPTILKTYCFKWDNDNNLSSRGQIVSFTHLGYNLDIEANGTRNGVRRKSILLCESSG